MSPKNNLPLNRLGSAAAASIEDNYEEYLDDECGFSYDHADRMTPEDFAAQDAILHASPEELQAMEGAALEPPEGLKLWMLARAWERLADAPRYFELCAQLLDAELEHPLVIYSEISRRVARQRAKAAEFSLARERLRAHLERWPEDLQAEQLSALIVYLESGDAADDSALRAFVARFPKDAEIRYEIAEDLWHFGRLQAASDWLHKAREVATQHDLTTLVDIELLSTRLDSIVTRSRSSQ